MSNIYKLCGECIHHVNFDSLFDYIRMDIIGYQISNKHDDVYVYAEKRIQEYKRILKNILIFSDNLIDEYEESVKEDSELIEESEV